MSALPSDSELEAALRTLVASDLTLQTRARNRYSSTYETERVSVLAESGPIDLLCKYGAGYLDPPTGHRRGVAYEATMYEHLLPDDSLATPRYHGTFSTTGSTQCLVLDYVDGYRVNRAPYPCGLLWTCTDLGRFHAQGPRTIPATLNVFNRKYFTRWAAEIDSLSLVGGTARRVIARLRELMKPVVDVLSVTPRTTIHGELYPANVIVQESGAVVVDWESAGRGPGVLDLAVLTQGHWDSDLVQECEAAYWANSGPVEKGQAVRSLAAARVFAAAQLLCHLSYKETNGSAEARAVNEIGTQLETLSAKLLG